MRRGPSTRMGSDAKVDDAGTNSEETQDDCNLGCADPGLGALHLVTQLCSSIRVKPGCPGSLQEALQRGDVRECRGAVILAQDLVANGALWRAGSRALGMFAPERQGCEQAQMPSLVDMLNNWGPPL